LAFSPTDGLTGAMVGSNIVLTFSEAIARGTGTITLRSGSATGAVVESFDAAASNRLTVSGSTLTINPTSDLAFGTKYFVVFTSGNIKDIAGNAYAGISTYDFISDDFSNTTASTGQVSVGGTVSTGAIGVSGDTDVFKVTLTAGATYEFALNATAGSLNPYLSLFDPDVIQVAFNNDHGSSVNSQITYTAAVSGTYYLLASGSGSATGSYSLSASVDKTAPTVLAFSPTDGLTGVAAGSNIVLTFSEAIARGTGTITLRSGSATGAVVESFDAATSSRLTLSGSTLTIDPTSDLSANMQYFVVFTSGNIKDIAGNAYVGISTYDFKTANIVNGTANNDTLTGTVDADTINGLAGNDIITGGAGTDSMDGGEGSDLYILAASADHAAAEFTDTGASGTDEVRFTSNTARSTLTLYAGDTGIEKVVIGTGTAAEAVKTATTALNVDASRVLNGLSIAGNAGANVITGTGYNDYIWGYAGNDTINGGDGDDTIDGGAGTNKLNGGSGRDFVNYRDSITAVTVSLAITTAQTTGGGGTDTLSGFEGILGGSGDDTLTGDGNNNAIYGFNGNDTINGGDGDDAISGGAGTNTLNGGAGIDAVDYRDSITAVTVSLAVTTPQTTGGGGTDTLSGFEGILGGSGNDTLTGDGNNNSIYGFNGNDKMFGSAGDDYLNGGAGYDDLHGGFGNDLLTGGSGDDWFFFLSTPNASTNTDTITDFTSADGDKLVFSKTIFTGLSGAALGDLSSDAFWSGAGVTTAHDADDRFIYNTTNGYLYYDADGNASGSAAVLVAILGAATPLAYTDLMIIG
jgi:Ca2+-binding RTX toxin-like protein